jgi:acyl-CoA thioester hydrolase
MDVVLPHRGIIAPNPGERASCEKPGTVVISASMSTGGAALAHPRSAQPPRHRMDWLHRCRAGIATYDRHRSGHADSCTLPAMAERFVLPITPAAADIDELGHVSNLVYLRWVQDVALAHSRALGWDMVQYRASGTVFMVRRHEIDYVAQVTLGQELRAETWVDVWKLASCIRRTEILRDDKVVARAATTWALIGLASGRPQRIPEDVVALFSR